MYVFDDCYTRVYMYRGSFAILGIYPATKLSSTRKHGPSHLRSTQKNVIL